MGGVARTASSASLHAACRPAPAASWVKPWPCRNAGTSAAPLARARSTASAAAGRGGGVGVQGGNVPAGGEVPVPVAVMEEAAEVHPHHPVTSAPPAVTSVASLTLSVGGEHSGRRHGSSAALPCWASYCLRTISFASRCCCSSQKKSPPVMLPCSGARPLLEHKPWPRLGSSHGDYMQTTCTHFRIGRGHAVASSCYRPVSAARAAAPFVSSIYGNGGLTLLPPTA